MSKDHKKYWGVIVNCCSAGRNLSYLSRILSKIKNYSVDFLILAGLDSEDYFKELTSFCTAHSTRNFLVMPCVSSSIEQKYLPRHTKVIASSVLNLCDSSEMSENGFGWEKLRCLREKDGFCYIYSPINRSWKTRYVPYAYFNGFAWNGKNIGQFQDIINFYLAYKLRTRLIGLNNLASIIDKDELIFVCVSAPVLEKKTIITAISSGKCFVSQTRDISLDYQINGKEVNDTFYTKSCSMITINTKCYSKNRIDVIQVVKNSHIIKEVHLQEKSYTLSFKDKILGEAHYRIVMGDSFGHVCLSNPFTVKTNDWQWGDNHIHIGAKDTSILAPEIGLDYVQLTEHLNPNENKLPNRIGLKQYCTDRFMALAGLEFHRSSKPGDKYGSHILAFRISRSYRGGKGVKETLDRLENDSALVFAAHPFIEKRIDFGGFPSFEEKKEFYPNFDGIEIVHGMSYHFANSPYETPSHVPFKDATDYVRTERLWDNCLSIGMRCTGIGNSDALLMSVSASNYTINRGIGVTPTIVYAEELQPEKIYRSLKDGYCWFTNGTFRYLDIWIDEKHMGEVFDQKKDRKSAVLRILVESVELIKEVIVIGNGETIKRINNLEQDRMLDIKIELSLSENLKYLRVKIIDRNGAIAFSNPIYLRKPLSKKEVISLLAKKGYRLCKEEKCNSERSSPKENDWILASGIQKGI